MVASFSTTKYIEIESPQGTHKIIAENTVMGFETGTAIFYRPKMSIFKEYITMIMLEKTGGLIRNGETKNFQWLSEDILKVEHKDYNKQSYIYEINFNTKKVREYIDYH